MSKSRFYLPSPGIVDSPLPNLGYSSVWTDTSQAFRSGTWRDIVATSPMTSRSGTTAASGNYVLLAQYVSDPLALQPVSGTLFGTVMAANYTGYDVFTGCLVVRLVSSDGTTDRGTLLSSTGGTSGTSDALAAGLHRQRWLPPGGETALTAGTILSNSRLVIEIGFRSTSTALSQAIVFGDNASTDLPASLVQTSWLNPWLQFSAPIYLATEASLIGIGDGGGPQVPATITAEAFANVTDVAGAAGSYQVAVDVQVLPTDSSTYSEETFSTTVFANGAYSATEISSMIQSEVVRQALWRNYGVSKVYVQNLQVAGPTGPAGAQGPPGVAANQGATGPISVIWAADPPTTSTVGMLWVESDVDVNYAGSTIGPTGPQGVQGTQGVAGPQGSVGPQGPQGYQGSVGAASTVTGPQGPQGSVGAASTVTGPQGVQGAQGPTGAGYDGVTSTTSITVGTGTKVFTVNKQGAFVSGSRVRMVSTATSANWVEGVVTITGGTSWSVSVDQTGGSGTIASWTASVAGLGGPQGFQGTQGPAGPQGNQGAVGAASTVTGPQGPQGNQGSVGAASVVTGPQGPQGAVGPQGAPGSSGATGSTGPGGNTTISEFLLMGG